MQSFLNALRFGLRSRLQWQKSGFNEFNDPFLAQTASVEQDWHALGLDAMFEDLRQRYDLPDWEALTGSKPPDGHSRLRLLESLTVLHHLDVMAEGQVLPLPKADSAERPYRWLDVGCKNWGYVSALNWFFTRQAQGKPLILDGIEIDAYRLYGNFHSRKDYADAFIRSLPHACYVVGDVLSHSGQYDMISLFLPFVVEDPCLAWGLPLSCFQPEAILSHVVRLLKPDGWLWIVNQGSDEALIQGQLLKNWQEHRTNQTTLVGHSEPRLLPESFMKYQYPHYGWCLQKVIHPLKRQSLENSKSDLITDLTTDSAKIEPINPLEPITP